MTAGTRVRVIRGAFEDRIGTVVRDPYADTGTVTVQLDGYPIDLPFAGSELELAARRVRPTAFAGTSYSYEAMTSKRSTR